MSVAMCIDARSYPTILEWFPQFCMRELGINEYKYDVRVQQEGVKITISLYEKATNKLIKHMYTKEDITEQFVLGWDGLYYDPAWSATGKIIVEDGLGWGLNEVRDYLLEYVVVDELSARNRFEEVFDTIRHCLR
ncbi:hypothetical protein [Bacillus cereus]|uniref:hypothetical protein n=1 Tax=Bacillus cereus TaxID=1396 RepID=UPI000BFDCE6F|nr:hypothetical protein [Bacillus cereus]PGR83676.1 hypothetical protein COC63_06730 [Bacillus cereus]